MDITHDKKNIYEKIGSYLNRFIFYNTKLTDYEIKNTEEF